MASLRGMAALLWDEVSAEKITWPHPCTCRIVLGDLLEDLVVVFGHFGNVGHFEKGQHPSAPGVLIGPDQAVTKLIECFLVNGADSIADRRIGERRGLRQFL